MENLTLKIQKKYEIKAIMSDGFKAVRALRTVLKKLNVPNSDKILEEFENELDKMGVE